MDSSNGMSQIQENISTSGSSNAVETQPPVVSPAQEERFFKQSEVNEIVKKAKYGAVEDFKRLNTQQPQYAQQKYGDVAQQHSQTSSPENEIRRMAAEEVQRLRDEWSQEAQTKQQTEQAQRTVQNFYQKISPGKEKYTDFEKVTGDINLQRFPNVVQLLGDYIDNSHDVLYELGKDRLKIAQLEQLAYMSPEDAIIQAQRLSQSIKDNEAAGKVRTPNEPLSQMRPSNTGTDNGVMSVKDLRRKYKM